MIPDALCDRLDGLIDDMFLDGGLEAAAVASVLLRARDSARAGDPLRLSREVWSLTNADLAPARRRVKASGPKAVRLAAAAASLPAEGRRRRVAT